MRMVIRNGEFTCSLKKANHLFAGDRREIIEESINRLARGQIVNQILHGDARTVKHRQSAKNIPIFAD